MKYITLFYFYYITWLIANQFGNIPNFEFNSHLLFRIEQLVFFNKIRISF